MREMFALMRPFRVLPIVALAACSHSPTSNVVAPPGTLPSVRSITTPSASFAIETRLPPVVLPLRDGRVLMLDPRERRLAVLDSTLSSLTTVFDQQTAGPLRFPGGAATMFEARGDSIWVYDPPARGFRVLDPLLRVVRRQGVANPDLGPILSAPNAQFAQDGTGRLIFLRSLPFGPLKPGLNAPGRWTFISRTDLVSPKVDSLDAVRNDGPRTRAVLNKNGSIAGMSLVLPLVESGDAWAVTSDGTVGIIRGDDFHVDWIDSATRRHQSKPVPWQWHRYAADELAALRQSAQSVIGGGQGAVVLRSSDGQNAPMAGPAITLSDSNPVREPAFAPNSAIADRQNRIWVLLGARQTMIAMPEAVYAIIDRNGYMVDRVRLPRNSKVVGFTGSSVVTLEASKEGYHIRRYELGGLR
jgi:hypothetical protein